VLRGTQREGTIAPIPIAIPQFLGEDPRFVAEMTSVVTADLERSGLFRVLDPTSFIEQIRDAYATPRFQDWRVIGAQALVVGRAGRAPDGRYFSEGRLYDVL
jgi:TolB protein